MEFKTLLFDVQDNLAHITLNRPDAANSINEEMGKDLMHAALRCDEDPEIRAVLISGAGKIFSGGGDLKAFWPRAKSYRIMSRSSPPTSMPPCHG